MWLRGNVEEWWQEFQCDLWITFRHRGWRAGRSALPRVLAWGCVFRCRDSPVGDLSPIAGTNSNAGGARPRNGLRCGCPRETSQTSTGGFLQWSVREMRTDIVDGPAADHRDRHLSPSLCFVAFVRPNNLAQNHFRNVSASCAGDPCWSLLNARVPWS